MGQTLQCMLCDSVDCCGDPHTPVQPSIHWENQMFVLDILYLLSDIHSPTRQVCTLYLLRTSHAAVEALISKQDTFVLEKTLPPPHSPLP